MTKPADSPTSVSKQTYDADSYANVLPEKTVHQHSDRIFHQPGFSYDEMSNPSSPPVPSGARSISPPASGSTSTIPRKCIQAVATTTFPPRSNASPSSAAPAQPSRPTSPTRDSPLALVVANGLFAFDNIIAPTKRTVFFETHADESQSSHHSRSR